MVDNVYIINDSDSATNQAVSTNLRAAGDRRTAGDNGMVTNPGAMAYLHLVIKLAVISHITSTPAVIYPVKRLTALFHRYGVQVLVDGAHCLGHISIDVQDIDSDYYVANGHKWLYSPKGSALLHVRPDRQEYIYPTTISYEGQGSSEFQIGFSYQGLLFCFESCASLESRVS